MDHTQEFRLIQKQLDNIMKVYPIVLFTVSLESPHFISSISENIYRLTGFASHEFIQDPNLWQKRVHPDDFRSDWVENHHSSSDDQASYNLRFLHKNGNYRWFSVKVIKAQEEEVNPGEVLGYLQDITSWREAEEAIRKSEELYRALAEASHDYIFVINRDDIVEYVNTYASNALNLPIEDIVGKPRSLLFPPEVSKKHKADIQEVLDYGQPHYYEGPVEIDGRKIWLGTWLATIHDQTGKHISVMGVARDISDQIKAEREIQIAYQQEKELSELRAKFVSTISHEFGTPLTTILSSAELLEHYGNDWTDDRKMGHYRRIQEAAKQMNSIINRVFDIHRMVLKKEVNVPVQVELFACCKEIIEDLEYTSEIRGRTRFLSSIDQMSAVIDKRLLRDVLNNLITNALKYSPPDTLVTIELLCDEKEGVISVKDEGIGIPEKDIPRLFEPFYRGSNIKEVNGKGLGLVIVKNSIELMGGDVQVSSKEGEGTTFRVRFPINQTGLSGNFQGDGPALIK